MLRAFTISILRSPAGMAQGGIEPLVPSADPGIASFLSDLWSKDPRQLTISLEDEAAGPVLVGGRRHQPVDDTVLRRQSRRWAGLVTATIRVPAHKCLIREMTLPKAALRRADEVLALDLQRTTPFRASEVLTAWYCPKRRADGDHVAVHQVILKRGVVDGVIEQLAQARIPLKAISVAATDGGSLPVNLLPSAQRQQSSLSATAALLLKALLVAVVGLNMTALGLTASNLNSAIARADQALQSITAEQQALRRKVGEAQANAAQIRQPRLRKLGSTPAVAIWEEVTRVLPSATMLSELRIEGTTVQLDGQSANASELVGLLAASPMFTNVAFASPVTRDAQRGGERFQIKLQVGRADAAERTPSAGAAK